MARRRRYYARPRYRTRYVSVRRGYRKRKGLFTGQMGNLLLGVAAGFGQRYIPQVLGKWTNPALFLGAGYIFKKQGLVTIGAYEIGRSLAGAGGLTNGNGFWEA